MSRSRLIFFVTSAVLVLLVVVGSLRGAVDREDDEHDSLYKYLSVFTEVLSLVRQAYVDTVDMDALMVGALDGTTEALDPFSIYLPAGELEAYAKAREVGASHSGLTVLKFRGSAFIAAVEPGGPGAEAGLKVGDILAEIQGRSTRATPLWEIQELLAAKPGTRVEMQIIRMPKGDRETVFVELSTFEPPPASLVDQEGSQMLQLGGLRPGNVAAVRQALEKADPRLGLLVDLRGVAGGSPEVAYQVAALLARGDLGELRQRDRSLHQFSNDEAPVWQGRLVVLVDRGTLGPAEILASVLQQKLEADLVGEPTFGYAGRQASVALASGGRLYYTDAFYTGPDGEALRTSLVPDVRVSSSSRSYDEKDLPIRDLILKRGLEQLRGEGTAQAAA